MRSVSYTHLDVYKRQVQNVFRHGSFRHRLMDKEAVAMIMAVSLVTINR